MCAYVYGQVIEVFGTQLTTEFLTDVMGPQSILPRLCFSYDRQVAYWSWSGIVKDALFGERFWLWDVHLYW